jgi:hypothetical protein
MVIQNLTRIDLLILARPHEITGESLEIIAERPVRDVVSLSKFSVRNRVPEPKSVHHGANHRVIVIARHSQRDHNKWF